MYIIASFVDNILPDILTAVQRFLVISLRLVGLHYNYSHVHMVKLTSFPAGYVTDTSHYIVSGLETSVSSYPLRCQTSNTSTACSLKACFLNQLYRKQASVTTMVELSLLSARQCKTVVRVTPYKYRKWHFLGCCQMKTPQAISTKLVVDDYVSDPSLSP